MTKYGSMYGGTRKPGPVSQPIPGRADMVKTSDGAFAFDVGSFGRFERFLVIGADDGTYYAGRQQHAVENCESAMACIQADGPRTVTIITEVSVGGRAVKNDPAVFALAMAAGAGDPKTRALALEALPKVCRIPTDLFKFCQTVENFRGWGRSLQRAVRNWYLNRRPDKLAYQVTKYKERVTAEGEANSRWNHKDVLRLANLGNPYEYESLKLSKDPEVAKRYAEFVAHDVTESPEHNTILRFLRGDLRLATEAEQQTSAYDYLLATHAVLDLAKEPKKVAEMVRKYRFGHEHVPSEALNHTVVWEALLENMPPTAMIRNLGKMTAIGMIAPFSQAGKTVVSALSNTEILKRNRVHPAAILMASKVYGQGKGVRGSLTWSPVPQVVQALDDAFYAAFNYLPPCNKNFLLAVDVSGSMDGSVGQYANYGFKNCTGAEMLTPREAAAVMAMVVARVEKNYHLVAFSDTLRDLRISPTDSLAAVIQTTRLQQASYTDIGLPIQEALAKKWPVDCFVSISDAEVNHGSHPSQLLQQFREKSGRDAKGIMMSMVANGVTTFDPKDVNSLNTQGFDTNAPRMVTGFASNWATLEVGEAEETDAVEA